MVQKSWELHSIEELEEPYVQQWTDLLLNDDDDDDDRNQWKIENSGKVVCAPLEDGPDPDA